MAHSLPLQDHIQQGPVCGICAGPCQGSEVPDRQRDGRPLLGAPTEAWNAWRQSQVPTTDFTVAREQVWENDVLVFNAGDRVPNERARELGMELDEEADVSTSTVLADHDQPDTLDPRETSARPDPRIVRPALARLADQPQEEVR